MLDTSTANATREQGQPRESLWSDRMQDEGIRLEATVVADNLLEEAWTRMDATAPPLDELADVYRLFPFQARHQVARFLDLERAWTSFLAAEGVSRWSVNEADRRAEMRAALDRIAEWRRRYAEAERDSRAAAAELALDAAWAAESETLDRLLLTPAPDLKALAWKVDRLFGPAQLSGEGEYALAWKTGWVAQIARDANRLAGAVQ